MAMKNASNRFPRLATGAVLLAALCLMAGGCAQRKIYPARGQIVDKAGNPIAGIKGSIIQMDCLDDKSSASGTADEEGKFQLSTNAVGDGAHVGRHRVVILRPDRGPDVFVPHVIDPKYEKFETSELTVVIEPRDNLIKFEVEKVR